MDSSDVREALLFQNTIIICNGIELVGLKIQIRTKFWKPDDLAILLYLMMAEDYITETVTNKYIFQGLFDC